MDESLTIVVYDIEKDRIRNKIADICKDYGLTRIQFSAFQGPVRLVPPTFGYELAGPGCRAADSDNPDPAVEHSNRFLVARFRTNFNRL